MVLRGSPWESRTSLTPDGHSVFRGGPQAEGRFFCAPAPPGSRGFDFGGNAVPSMSFLVLGSFCAKAAGLAGIRARGSWWYNASVNATGALALAGA